MNFVHYIIRKIKSNTNIQEAALKSRWRYPIFGLQAPQLAPAACDLWGCLAVLSRQPQKSITTS
jgi:hypothetical protein